MGAVHAAHANVPDSAPSKMSNIAAVAKLLTCGLSVWLLSVHVVLI